MQDLAALARDRAGAYGFLASVCLERPDDDMVAALKSGEFTSALKNLMTENPGGRLEGLDDMDGFLKETAARPDEEVAEDLAVDFTRLFRGISKGYGPPPPYESVYRGEDRVMGGSTRQVMKEYEEAGIPMAAQGPPDYLGYELRFMALLCSRESGTWEAGDGTAALSILERERDFLMNHLLEWVPEFCEKVEEEAKTGFYKGFAGLTKSFIGSDLEQIDYNIEYGKELV